jgi:hypothetical protein
LGGCGDPNEDKGTINNDAIGAQYLYNVAHDIQLLQEAESRQKRILDASYKAVDIDKYILSLLHLNNDKAKLIKVLTKHTRLLAVVWVL